MTMGPGRTRLLPANLADLYDVQDFTFEDDDV